MACAFPIENTESQANKWHCNLQTNTEQALNVSKKYSLYKRPNEYQATLMPPLLSQYAMAGSPRGPTMISFSMECSTNYHPTAKKLIEPDCLRLNYFSVWNPFQNKKCCANRHLNSKRRLLHFNLEKTDIHRKNPAPRRQTTKLKEVMTRNGSTFFSRSSTTLAYGLCIKHREERTETNKRFQIELP